jgi:hypothetical protein
MKLPQLKKAQKLFDRVQELDKEIIEIEKSADLIANKRTEIKLSLKVNDTEEKEKEKSKVEFDEDGSIIQRMQEIQRGLFGYITMNSPGFSCEKQKKEYTLKQDHVISDNVALQVLGVILADKMEARKLAIKALNKIGIEI